MDNPSSASHRRVQKSTTLNRKYVKKPEARSASTVAVDSVAKRRAEDLKRRQALAEKINRERLAAMKTRKSVAMAETAVSPSVVVPTPEPKPLSATIERSFATGGTTEPAPTKNIKDSALESAMKATETVDKEPRGAITSSMSSKGRFGAKKVLLALGCAALAVGVVGYFVSVNTPDISVKVAAMQSGIEAAYPSYVPRGYSLSDIVSEEGKLTMTFSSSDGTSFVLDEEKSAWDNDTLEANYAKTTWGTNYTSVREQGITIFIAGSDAAWVNGGILYKLTASGNNLTKKQIKSIVTSL